MRGALSLSPELRAQPLDESLHGVIHTLRGSRPIGCTFLGGEWLFVRTSLQYGCQSLCSFGLSEPVCFVEQPAAEDGKPNHKLLL